MGKDRSGGKTIYIRKGESKEDAAKRYEGGNQGAASPPNTKQGIMTL